LAKKYRLATEESPNIQDGPAAAEIVSLLQQGVVRLVGVRNQSA
jgi:hypothetical protein